MVWVRKVDTKSTIPGPQGEQGPRGFDGVNALPTDTALASYVADPEGLFRGELDSTFSPRSAWNVERFGAKGGGVIDDSAAFSAAFAAARDAVVAGFGARNVVEIPAGRYKITSTIVIPPYVKLRTLGQVVLEWAGTDSSCLWVTPRAEDPWQIYPPLSKQEEQNADIIDGRVGGLVILNTVARDGINRNVGLELGPRVDLGVYRPLARYAMANVAIKGFDVAMMMNAFNHYIGKFTRFQIEMNTVGVQIGTGTNMNSGENFAWDHCVFASLDWAFDVRVPGFDHNFMSCSMDYLYKGVIKTAHGYHRYHWSGGHIEAINYPTPTSDGGIVVSTAAVGEVQLHFDGTTLLARKQNLFKGTNLHISGTIFSRLYDDDTRTEYPLLVMAEPTVRATGLRNLWRANRYLISRDTNRIQDPLWQRESVGVKASLLDWLVTPTGGATYEIAADSPDAGGQALRVTLPVGASIKLVYKYALAKYDLDETYGTCVLKTSLLGINAGFAMQLLGADGVLIGESASVSGFGVTAIPVGGWNMPRTLVGLAAASFSSFYKAASFKPVLILSNPAGAAGPAVVTVPMIYAGR